MTDHTASDRTTRLAPPAGHDQLLWELHASESYLLWLAAADDFGLFPALETTSAPPEDIARQLQLSLTTTEALLGALAALGFLVQYDGHYALTQPARDFLLPSSPYYRGPWLELVRRRPRLTYQDIAGALRRNRMLDDHFWEVEDTDPEQARRLAQALHVLSLPAAPALAAAADCSCVRHLLDVGGGAGSMSIALAHAYPALRCTVLDRQVPCALATEHIAAHALEARIATHPANMFTDAWPAGHDAILLSHILNCFDATRCAHLLQQAHDCLPSGGLLYIQEMLLPNANDGPLALTALSLHGHLWGQGKQWAAGELTAMLAHAGFTLERLAPAYGYNAVLTAIKP